MSLNHEKRSPDLFLSSTAKYVGCLEIFTSMKVLDFETRSQIAKECINRVCESAGLKTGDKKKKMDKRFKMLSETPILENAGENVNLTITSSFLNLTVMETGKVSCCCWMNKSNYYTFYKLI